MVQTIRPEWSLRKRSQEQVAVWRGGKGKQVKQENKISNPVHVTGFEAQHFTTCAGTRLRLSAKRTNPFKSARGASVQSTTDRRVVRISGSNVGYTMFRGSVKSTGYPLHSPVSPSQPPPLRHRVPSHFNWTLPSYFLLS